MDPKSIQQALVDMGFLWETAPGQPLVDGNIGPHTAQAIRGYQQAYAGSMGALAVDGIAGPQTQQALQWSASSGGRLSEHFSASETRCKHCGRNVVHRQLLNALDNLRNTLAIPLVVLDVYRCATHNAAVGGKGDSQHLFGLAADPSTPVPVGTALQLGQFSGVGCSDGVHARHVDVRHVSPATNPTPNAGPRTPARFSE